MPKEAASAVAVEETASVVDQLETRLAELEAKHAALEEENRRLRTEVEAAEEELSLDMPSPPQRKFRIMVAEQDNSDLNGDVFVNDGYGKQYLIKRGEEVVIPEGVLRTLEECVITRLIITPGGDQIVKNIPRFAVKNMGEVTA